ncbi:LEAF RUST 10 DISEASE-RESISTANCEUS RECEPTOR-LIKE PROTEIN KINASE-like 2.4 [Euphorbia lathyris]|uniref:LEAF RUST 10 DISEASE-RESISTANCEUS RECEPTOR-LIKE PROTEIN KINASE-like 2.4 n=1 Tax=Euphorbia lathyris TaxID=212925 RepID=UPI0033139549
MKKLVAYLFQCFGKYSIIMISLFILLIFAPSSYSQEDMHYSECVKPFDCGNLTNLSYPFWSDGRRSELCGFEGFKLRCVDDEFPAITIENKDFLVVSIDQSQKEMAIAPMDLWDDSCPDDTGFTNITLATSPFSFVPDFYTKFSNISLFYNCTDLKSTQRFGQFGCRVNGEEREAFYVYDVIWGRIWMPECTIKVQIPVPQTSLVGDQGLNDLGRVLREGFNVSYNYNEDCVKCSDSGGICGTNLTNRGFTCLCPGHPYPDSCPKRTGSDRNIFSSVKVKALFGIAMALVGVFFISLFMRNRQITPCFLRKNQDFEAFLESHGPLAVKRYSYSQVKKMTNSFKEKLGQGGYGSVYKGKLLDDRLVAVKMLNVSKEELGQDFINEVAAISRTSHINIVSLLGFCLEGQKRALVYEFMPNGSLDKFICDQMSDQHLLWETIEQIAIGIAQGLEYLHRGCNTRIVHFDIKPHNVLLDEKLSPKISDFGLAKLCARKESIVSMLEARGTIGYIAPEVFSRNFGQVSSKSDVYSYGMMILEIIGVRKKDEQVGGSNSSEIYFPSWIYKSLELENGNEAIREEDKEGEIVRKLKLIGLWCIQTNPLERPTMSNVIDMLRGSTQNLSIPPKPFLSSSSPPPPFPLSSYSLTTSTV